MTDHLLTDLHPLLQPIAQQWLDKCQQQEINSRIIQTYRSAADQNADYAVGRDSEGNIIGKIITNAKAGQSPHNVTLNGKPASVAFDWTIIKPDGTCDWVVASPEWQAAVAIGKSLNLIWGGDFTFRDCDHFELPRWKQYLNQ